MPEAPPTVEPFPIIAETPAIQPAQSPQPTRPTQPVRQVRRAQPPQPAQPAQPVQRTEQPQPTQPVPDTSGQRESDASPSVPDITSRESANAARGALQPQQTPSIAGVDSVIVVNRVRPVYPQISRRRGEEGDVILLAEVRGGRVVNVAIERSSGVSALDSSAVTAVGRWSFSPDTNLTVRIPVSFRLRD